MSAKSVTTTVSVSTNQRDKHHYVSTNVTVKQQINGGTGQDLANGRYRR